MLQGQKDMLTVGKLILSELAPVVSAQHGVFYVVETPKEETTEQPPQDNDTYLKLLASYAFRNRKNVGNRFSLGEGLVGQAALEKERILITNAPERLRPDHLRPRPGHADQYHRAARAL